MSYALDLSAILEDAETAYFRLRDNADQQTIARFRRVLRKAIEAATQVERERLATSNLGDAIAAAKAVSDWTVYEAEDSELAIRRRTPDELIAAQVTAAAELLEAATLRQFADAIEGRESLLCDCDRSDDEPTNPYTHESMDHYCDCVAVQAAATVFPGQPTRHDKQCTQPDTREEYPQVPSAADKWLDKGPREGGAQ